MVIHTLIKFYSLVTSHLGALFLLYGNSDGLQVNRRRIAGSLQPYMEASPKDVFTLDAARFLAATSVTKNQVIS